MKVLTIKELESKSLKELIKKRWELLKSLFEMRLKNSMKALTQTHHISLAKRNIARINTVLTLKQAT
jgi:large subunit ribosomal protein L29